MKSLEQQERIPRTDSWGERQYEVTYGGIEDETAELLDMVSDVLGQEEEELTHEDHSDVIKRLLMYKHEEWIIFCSRKIGAENEATMLFEKFIKSEFFEGVLSARPPAEEMRIDEELLELAQEQFPFWLIRYKKLSKPSRPSPRRGWQSVEPSPELTRSKKPPKRTSPRRTQRNGQEEQAEKGFRENLVY